MRFSFVSMCRSSLCIRCGLIPLTSSRGRTGREALRGTWRGPERKLSRRGHSTSTGAVPRVRGQDGCHRTCELIPRLEWWHPAARVSPPRHPGCEDTSGPRRRERRVSGCSAGKDLCQAVAAGLSGDRLEGDAQTVVQRPSPSSRSGCRAQGFPPAQRRRPLQAPGPRRRRCGGTATARRWRPYTPPTCPGRRHCLPSPPGASVGLDDQRARPVEPCTWTPSTFQLAQHPQQLEAHARRNHGDPSSSGPHDLQVRPRCPRIAAASR